MTELYCTKRFLLITLDPVHIGTGGMRLGRVDNSIVREPGTRLPKIPGTSLSGAIRQYAAMRYESPRCAGSGQNTVADKRHCTDDRCPICYTFGHLKGQDGGQSGTVSIGDARLLLFPVYSLAGPVWVTCPSVLRELIEDPTLRETIMDPGEAVQLPKDLEKHQNLNLGWLMLPKATSTFNLPQLAKKAKCEKTEPQDVSALIRNRTVLVSDKLFSQIVNSNLEVRTSVSIDPETGAAKDRALFTYEAIPRSAILWMDVVQDDFQGKFSSTDKKYDATNKKHNAGNPLEETWTKPLDVVKAGLKLAEHLGIGGMGTRGFGRIRLEAHWEVKA